MTYHHRLAAPRIIAPGGPVSAALRTMLANVEACDRQRLRDLRQRIADRIEADLALLDAIGGDPDIEQDAGEMPEGLSTCAYPGATEDDEPSLGSLQGTAAAAGGQWQWAGGGTDDREVDVHDEPHDEDTDHEPDVDAEPTLCGIHVSAHFATGSAMGAGEDEPSLAGLGGTAAGCEGSQVDWADGNQLDLEVGARSKAHRQGSLWHQPGAALIEVRQKARDLGRSSRESRVVDLRFLGRF